MELKSLEYIVTIADEKNITKASQKLFISQSALNQTLLNIEKKLNTKLFMRSNRQMCLTNAGKIYVEYSRKILELRDEAYQKIRNLNKIEKNQIHIGLTRERGNQMMVKLYPDFHKKYLNTIILASEYSVKKQLELLKENNLDLGVLTITPDIRNEPLSFAHLADEDIVLCVPNNPRYTKDQKEYDCVSLERFKDEDVILINKDSTLRRIQDGLFRKNNIEPKIIFETESNKISYNLVAANLGITILPKTYAIPNEKVFFLSLKEHPKWEIVVAYNKNLTDEEKYFIDLCKSYWTNLFNSNNYSYL